MLKKSHTLLAAIAIGSFAAAAFATVQEPPTPPPPPPPMGEKMFERLDTNHDGVIDRSEFDAVRERLGRRLRGENAPQREQGPPRGEGNLDGPRGQGDGPNQGKAPGEGRFRGPRDGGPPGKFRRGPMGGPRSAEAIQEIQRVIRKAVDDALRDHPAELREQVGNAVIEALKSHMQDRMSNRHEGPGPGPGQPGIASPPPPPPGQDAAPRHAGPPPLGGPRGPGHGGQRRVGPDRGSDDEMSPPPGGRPQMEKRRRGDGQQGKDMNDQRGRFREPANRDGQGWRKQGEGERPGMRFKKMDANSDGFLTPDEFKGSRERFDLVDANTDGKLTKQELRDAFRRHRDSTQEDKPVKGNQEDGKRGVKRERNAKRVVI